MVYDIRRVRELCAQAGDGDSCRGDSGGPLITRFTYPGLKNHGAEMSMTLCDPTVMDAEPEGLCYCL